MSNENGLRIWNKFEKTDPKFTSRVAYGGFKYTSANPQWQLMRATEHWGPIGIGWGFDYELSERDFANGEVSIYCKMRLWYVEDGQEYSTSHVGVCRYARLEKDSDRLVIDDEAPKKAVTNAISKSLSTLGFSADLWLKYYDSKEYQEIVAEDFRQQEKQKSDDGVRNRLRVILEQSGAEPASEDEELLCRFWSNGEYGSFDAMDDIEAAKVVCRGQSDICSGSNGREKVIASNHLVEARKRGWE